MSNLYYINYSEHPKEGVWYVKKVLELDAEGNSIIFGKFFTKEEAENFIKELLLKDGEL